MFLFDEPLSNLDAELRVQMRVEIRAAPQGTRHHHDLCHARPDRGDDARRQDRRAAGRQYRADRRAARPLRRSGQPVRRRLRRLAEDELHGGEGRRGRRRSRDRRTGQPGGARLRKPLPDRCPPSATRSRSACGRSISSRPAQGDCDLTVTVDVVEHLGSASYLYANAGPRGAGHRARGIAASR